MTKFRNFLALAALGLLCACGHHGTIPATSGFIAGNESISEQTIVRHGNFTEYTLPAGAFPGDITRGPYSTLWFPSASSGVYGAPARVGEFFESTGATHIFTAGKVPTGNGPAQLVNSQGPIISVGGAIFYVADDGPDDQNEIWAIRVTPQGAFTYKDMFAADTGITNFTLGANGALWFGFCTFSDCTDGGVISAISTTGFIPGSASPSSDPRMDNGFCPNWVQSGPLSDIYTTSDDCFAAPPTGASRVYVNTTAGTIIHRFPLPVGSKPGRIVTGSDHNLWIVEPGINKIARMTPTGIVTQFAMRTANAGLSGITPGADGALWFTENKANKIGRITTAGAINEYPIPTPSSGPNGLVPCTTACPPHGGVWFTETKANKIGKFVSPL